ncbi:protocatechuate 3,4-dioxygenase subunit alpha [Devosia sp. SL43]|uniref:protocatechuate 3,4-dioxygenase subunit alpha n=1 Tax=Devosia sp. SL43 TaxID=2806348 RepID=UPI001F030097|nr:protocatechuate 3,4-dioxygenase subunit alpha [Devosia sp. SL43]UJW84979.1 protocatechuate 3,4-dioxygenase subunit alpha [Devosia sp. SL43]
MPNKLVPLRETPSQTGGPYVHIGLMPNSADLGGVYPVDLGASMLTSETTGERIAVTGRLLDGSDAPLTDAVVELWQADARGSYTAPDFSGFGRQATDGEGIFRFDTIKPGRVAGPGGTLMAPHLTFWITARGINTGLHTRVYFGDEAAANESDPVLLSLLDPRRRKTLISTLLGAGHHHLDIRLQGPDETVFLDF